MNAFTLLEVLIALVILALAFISVFSSISANSRALQQVQNKTAAQLVALNVLAESQLGLIDYSENNKNHRSKERMFNQDWQCLSSLKEGDQPGSYKMELQVSLSKSSTTLAHLTGYLRK
jgi:type II secretion system protein I